MILILFDCSKSWHIVWMSSIDQKSIDKLLNLSDCSINIDHPPVCQCPFTDSRLTREMKILVDARNVNVNGSLLQHYQCSIPTDLGKLNTILIPNDQFRPEVSFSSRRKGYQWRRAIIGTNSIPVEVVSWNVYLICQVRTISNKILQNLQIP